MISLFGGTGFLGSQWRKQTSHRHTVVHRNDIAAPTREILWLISTTHNYHVFDEPFLDIETNLTRLIQTLRTIPKNGTFNFVSSWFVYGHGHDTHPVKETAHCDPRGFYSITKRTAEQLLISYCTTHGINWRIFRLSNLYGPGDKNASPKKNALTHLVSLLKKDEDVPLYWGGDCLRDFLHVSDAVRALDICLANAPANSITNIGRGFSYSMGNLLFIAKHHLGSQSKFVHVDPPEFHTQVGVRHFNMDTTKLQKLGFVPEVDVRTGIGELCDSR